MEVLSKVMIERWIMPHLSKGARGPALTVEVVNIIRAIFYQSKTGCQWRMLPTKAFFGVEKISWSGIYYHHRRWIKDGSWRRVWIALLKSNKHLLDLSSMQLDGSQSPAKKQGTTSAIRDAEKQERPMRCFSVTIGVSLLPWPHPRQATTMICTRSGSFFPKCVS